VTALKSLTRAMWLSFVRDRAALFFTIIFPMLFLVLFGGIFKYAGPPKANVIEIGQVALLDQAQAQDGQGGLGKVLKIQKSDNRADALDKVSKGDVDAAVEQNGGTVVLHYSAASQVTSGTVIGLFESLVQTGNLAAAGVTTPALTLDAQQVEDKSLQTIQFVTPGILSWAISIGAVFAAALMLVTWRQKKILRRLRLSPVPTASLMSARAVVSLGIALGQMALFLGVASLPYFGLKLQGYWWVAIPLVIVGTLAFLSIGLVVGAFAKTQEAANVFAQLIVLPMAFLSGAFFPLQGAPPWLQGISRALPMRHLVDGLRVVLTTKTPPWSVLGEMGILLAFAVVAAAIGVRLFRWDDA
jgi:ABC-2 type transport system permease protein